MPRQNTPPADYPHAVLLQIERLAQNIVIARKRRGESQAQWARQLGVSQPTMARIERGDPSVAMASYVMCMWLINQAGGLAELIAPQHDHAALEKEVAKVRAQPKRRRNGPDLMAALAGAPAAGAQKTASDAPELLEDLKNNAAASVHPALQGASKRLASGSPAAGLAALMAHTDRQKK